MPVLMIHKIDGAILKLKVGGENMYPSFPRVIGNFNFIIVAYENVLVSLILQNDRLLGTCAMGSDLSNGLSQSPN